MIYQEIDGIKFKMGKVFNFDFLKNTVRYLRYMMIKIQETSVSE